jgi:hypothetical protein
MMEIVDFGYRVIVEKFVTVVYISTAGISGLWGQCNSGNTVCC